MVDKEPLEALRQGVSAWTDWRRKNPKALVTLRHANLNGVKLPNADLRGIDFINVQLRGANLHGSDLHFANLIQANLRGADLSVAHLRGACFADADMREVYLYGSDLFGADLSNADLREANLTDTILNDANFRGANLKDSTFYESVIGRTIFADIDLRFIGGLEMIRHAAPSEISMSTIYKSEGNIPLSFLLGCGVHESFIAQIPALVGAVQPIQFYSCFISYSSKDEDFARSLHARMRDANLRVWFAPEDIKGGEKLYEQIDRAIQVHDRLLLVLSENSMQSEWVRTEIRRARKTEMKEGRRKLFPIRLVGYDAIKNWECFDADHGKDLAVEVREYYIPDFSNWKSRDDFERAFARLLADLKASVE